jgi:hypothetical protein
MRPQERAFCCRFRFPPFPIGMAISQQWNRSLDPRRPFRVAGRGVFGATVIVKDNHRARKLAEKMIRLFVSVADEPRDHSSSSGDFSGVAPGDSRGYWRPCFKPPDFSESDFSSEVEGDRRGVVRGPNLADGDGREDGDSSGSTLWRGEISECGAELDLGEVVGFGETDGLGDAVTEGATELLGETPGVTVGVGLEPKGQVVVLFENHLTELLSRSFSIISAVRTSPSLNLLSDFVAGRVAVGAWPTGIGSYCSPTAGLISFVLK